MDLERERVSQRKSSSILIHLKPSSIDFYSFIFWFSVNLPTITQNQIVQDKICLNDLDLDLEECADIQKNGLFSDLTVVYTTAIAYNMLEVLVLNIPAFILMLFLSSLLDQYPQWLKYILVSPQFGHLIRCVSVIYQCWYFDLNYKSLLYANIPFGLLGGNTAVYSAIWTYASKKNSNQPRMIRFGLIEFFRILGLCLSSALGGYLLTQKPWFNHQIRNYIGVYLVSGFSSLIAIGWALTMLNDLSSDNKKKAPEKNITIGSNVFKMLKTCGKKRPFNNQILVWHLIASLCSTFFFLYGESLINYQFVQKVYGWDAQHFANVEAIVNIFPIIGSILFPAILGQKLQWRDSSVGILGSATSILSCIILGSILKPEAYYVSGFFQSFTKLLSIAFRSIISKIVDFDEVGQIFTFIACIEAIIPVISGSFYGTIFNKTIEIYPGFVYHMVGFIMIYPLVVTLWLNLTHLKGDEFVRVIKTTAIASNSRFEATEESPLILKSRDAV